MTAQSFAATVGAWAAKVPNALEAVFKEAAQELVSQLNELVPVDTGFLRASLMASTSAMPQLTRANPGVPVHSDVGDIVLAIAGPDLGDTLYLGYTANYARLRPLWRAGQGAAAMGDNDCPALGNDRGREGCGSEIAAGAVDADNRKFDRSGAVRPRSRARAVAHFRSRDAPTGKQKANWHGDRTGLRHRHDHADVGIEYLHIDRCGPSVSGDPRW